MQALLKPRGKTRHRRQLTPASDWVGETEYRCNWMPLGGYVKMLGQDDTKPGMVDATTRAATTARPSASGCW